MATLYRYDYEVFLSFRGTDTGAAFTDFLYNSLKDVGIRTYRDDEELHVGEEIGPELLQAIKQSKISIPIFSKGYASSVRCLKELVQMVECQRTRGQKIMPIFYDMTPSKVRYQTGGYEEAFLSHEKKQYDKETMLEWKAALSLVGALKGWDLQSLPNRREGQFVKRVTQEVFNELEKDYSIVSDHLVIFDLHVDEIMEMIGAPSETRIVGIHGIAGIGKTTIATIIYKQLSNNFEYCCFLSVSHEMSKFNCIECLQNQLISNILKKERTDIKSIDERIKVIKDTLSDVRVLLLLDDVDEKNHMDALLGNHDWFGNGSKLIITTRKKEILDVPEVDCSYELKGMDPNQHHHLFSEPAFGKKYHDEIFLSFRGVDTRAGFADFLYTNFEEAGIRIYMDEKELGIGEEIGPELLKAINRSKISIPIFSRGYASSIWCLKELVHMMECQKTRGHKIMPIFYDVAPSVVKFQTESYGEAFLSHEEKKRYDKETMHEWRAALSTVGAMKGWVLHSKQDSRQEGEFAKKITQTVFNELKKVYLVESDSLVYVDSHVDKIMEMIGDLTSQARIIGIHGMGGVGKTIITKIIYNTLLGNFQYCCFLSDIREVSKLKGIECLQNQLISDILERKSCIRNIDEGTQMIKDRLFNRRVLLVLDDVEEKNHVDALLGKCDWFGKGSKVIITTRKKDVLNVPEVDCNYEITSMDFDQSLQLFSRHAFRRDSPLAEYVNQSKKAICIAGGLPLALEVIGSLLSRTEKKKWGDTLKKLERIPHKAIQSKLGICYYALDDWQKHIFLDIACLFIGYDKDILVQFWDKSNNPEDSMEVLMNMSLIKITDDNKVWMHDELKDLGRQIVRHESEMEIEMQSRVWNSEETLDLLSRRKGKTKVEALRLRFDHEGQYCFTYKDFERLSNLRFLEVDGSKENFRAVGTLLWHESPSHVIPTTVLQQNSNLLPELRWLSWHDIPPTFNITNFSAANVVILNLSQSEITDEWKGWSHVKMMENLKVLDLSHCNYLKRTPDFSAHSKLEQLERLILKVCWGLVEIDKSICQLKSLVFLDVNYCKNLQRLPNTIGDLKSLKKLDILNTGIKRLPDSIGNLKLLDKLNISGMGIEKLPHSIRNLESLIELDISYSKIKELPDSIGELENLKVVKMNGCSISKIPDALWTIEKLKVIEVKACCHFDVKIGNGIYRNRALRILELNEARIYEVPRLPEGLTILRLFNLYMNTFPDLSNLTNLKKLELEFAQRDSDGESDGPVEEDPMPLRIGNLSKLQSRDLRSPYVTALPDKSLLPHLRVLTLRCPDLHCLPSLPSSLSELDLESECVTALPTDMSSLLPRLKTLLLRCPNLPCLPSLPSSLSSLWLESKCVTTLPTDMSTLLPRLGFLKLCCCPNLCYLPSLPSSLGCLWLEDGKSCRSMGDLSNLKTLKDLIIFECAISEIQGLDRLENLEALELGKLQQVEILPDLRNLNELWSLQVSNCGNLVEIQGEFPSSLEALEILDCGSLQKLPDLSSLKELPRICLERCEKLDVAAIYSLYPEEEDVKSEGDDNEFGCEFDDESEGEDDESGCEIEYGSEGED